MIALISIMLERALAGGEERAERGIQSTSSVLLLWPAQLLKVTLSVSAAPQDHAGGSAQLL